MSDQTSVLHDEVAASATRFRTVGDTVQDAVGKVGACSFGAGTAGREYAAQGSAVQAGTSRASQVATAWQTTTGEVADNILIALGLYAAQEEAATSAVAGIVS